MNITEEQYLAVIEGTKVHMQLLVQKVNELQLTISGKEELLKIKNNTIEQLQREGRNLQAEKELVYTNCVTFCPRCSKIVVYRDGSWNHIDRDGHRINDILIGHTLVNIGINKPTTKPLRKK